MATDIEIARAKGTVPIGEVAARLGLGEADLHAYGRDVAKVDRAAVARAAAREPRGKLILVTAISPTPAGEGKTTTTVGLGDALNRIGRKTAVCLREPSLGPCFGMKGGAAGGGQAQVVPMERINLHFTGDFHAIGSANNLLAALLDNHLHWGNALGLDPRRISWRRCVDMNDRALREIVGSLGGPGNGVPREDGFDITVASEVMAILCLATDLGDLEARLARIVVGETWGRKPVTAGELGAPGAMAVLLADAIQPNLVQTLERNPALVHGGPFANIAHGCNSVTATRTALGLADYVVTEAGFGADLGAEKFIDIKCRQAGLAPSAAVLVATVRALKMHGGVAKAALGAEDVEAVRRGFANLARHASNLRERFGLKIAVAINRFVTDTDAEVDLVRGLCRDELGIDAFPCTHWADGGAGAEALAARVVELAGDGPPPALTTLYPDDMPLLEKIRTVATRLYGAAGVACDAAVERRLKDLEAQGHGRLPVCMAKTQYSFAADPTLLGAPSGHVLPVRGVRLSAGAGFVVALCGDVMTMPGLPRSPSAERIRLDADGLVEGLF